MKTTLIRNILLVMVFCLASSSQAQNSAPVVSATPLVSPVSTPSSTPAASETPVVSEKSLNLGGKFGIGTDSIRLDETLQGGTNFTTASLTALDATYWLSDKSGLDFLGTFTAGSSPSYDLSGNPSDYPNKIWGLGLGFRRNLGSPIRNLRLQGLFRATYAQYTTSSVDWLYVYTPTAYQVQSQFNETFLLSAGLGFEYFLPFCDSLSVQSNLAYTVSQNDGWVSQTFNPNLPNLGYPGFNNSTLKYSYLRTGFAVNGLTLSSVSIHFYF